MWSIDSWYRESHVMAQSQSQFIQKTAENLLCTLESALPGIKRAEIAHRLQELNVKRLNAVPDLNKFPELRGMRELIAASWRGVKDGAKLDDEHCAAYCDSGYYYQRCFSSGKAAKPEKARCSHIFFPTSDRGPLWAHNLDEGPDDPFPTPEWPIRSEHLITGSVSSGVPMDEEPREIFPAPVYKLVHRYCRTTDEAVELLHRYNHFWGPTNMIVVDRKRNIAQIEKSSCRIGIRRSTDFGFITAMTQCDPDMKTYISQRRAAWLNARNLSGECADIAYWREQDRRGRLMGQLLDDARSNPTLETLRQFIQFRSQERGNVCCNGEVLFPGGPPSEYTVRTVIYLLKEGRAMWWARDGGKPSFESRKPDIAFENVWLWD